MEFQKLFCILISVVVLFSCSNSTTEQLNGENGKALVVNDNFVAGKIINKIVCKADTTQSYALYLPVNYSGSKKYPVIYIFDPHASGTLPVSLYKDLAEKYNYIVVGSNNSKNGTSWEESQIIANKLFADVGTRLSIDAQRIYLLGFSGGARVANTLTITNGAINSVICCGAAAPLANNTNPRSNYCFLGMVGNEDFNCVEMKRYDMIDLAGHNVKHSLITYSGKHEWPSADIMDEGFWWLELNEMRRNSSAKSEKRLTEHFAPLMDKLETYNKKKQIVEAYYLSRKIINFYDGVADLSRCYEIFKAIQGHPEVDKALRQEEQTWSEEEKIKKEYINAFQTKDIKWWKSDIASLKQKIKTGKDTNKVLIYKRVLNFLSLVAYMQTSNTLKQNALPAADFCSEIYVLVDPENNEAHYLRASVLVLQGDSKKANVALADAVKNGFIDKTRLQSDTTFNKLRGTTEFDELIKKIPAR